VIYADMSLLCLIICRAFYQMEIKIKAWQDCHEEMGLKEIRMYEIKNAV
jgi:hypothetical protein